MKFCSKCKENKEELHFSKDSFKNDKLRSTCKKCDSLSKKRYYKNNKESIDEYRKKHYEINKTKIIQKHKLFRQQYPEKTKNFYLKAKYGLNNEKYNSILEKQNYTCGSCGNEEKDCYNKKDNPNKYRTLAVDHDHLTGEIRGLLCRKCNVALGLLEENPEKIEKLKQYILKYKI